MLAHLELRHHLCPRRLSSSNVPSAADEVCADVRRYVAAPRQYVTPFDSRSDTDVLADRYGELRVSGRFSWRAQLVCQRCAGLGLQRRRSYTSDRLAAASAEAHRCRRCSRGASAARGRRVPGQLHPTSSVSGKALSGTGAVEATRGRLGAVHTAETDRQPARAGPGRPVGPGSQSICISPLRRSDAANSGSVSKILVHIFLLCGLGPPL